MLINTAYRMLKRSLRESELTLMLTSLIIALLCFTSISMLTKSIEMTMGLNASEFLGGNLVASSPTPIPQTWKDEATSYNLDQADSVNFMSVLSANDQWQLSSIKAVSPNYPLFGTLKLGKQPYQFNPNISNDVIPGTILLSSRLYTALNIHQDDKVQVGNAHLTSNIVLINDPITGRGFFNFSPKALISLKDLSKTQVIQPGSRIDYRWYLRGNDANINKFSTWLSSHLDTTQRLLNAKNERGSLKTAFDNVNTLLKISILMALSLTAIAITISIRQYIEKQKKTMALLRCFGMSNLHVMITYLIILFAVSIIGATIGILLGIVIQCSISYILQTYLIMPTLSYSLLLIPRAFFLGLLLTASVTLPWLWQIYSIAPNQLLTEQETTSDTKHLLPWLLAICLSVAASYLLVKDWSLLKVIAGGYTIAITILLMLNGLYAKALILFKNKLPIGYRYGLLNIVRHRWYAFAQITAFSLTFTTLLLLTLISQNLLLEWKKRLQPNTPNYFIFNFTQEQINPLTHLIDENTKTTLAIYPMVRGRLTQLNYKPILEAIPPKARNNNALHRALNLSSTRTVPEDNLLTHGKWWQEDNTKTTEISVEQNLARHLGIVLGDTLTFKIGASTISGVVSNLREVNWTSLHPNFYFIFSPNTLEDYPTTYISSFFLKNSDNNLLLKIAKTFPNLTIIDLGDIISQIRSALSNIRYLILYLTSFILCAGIALLYSSILATLDIRRRETSILNLLGAGPRIIKQSLLAEFGGIGIAASTTAVLVSQLMLYALSQSIGFLSYHWLWAPNIITLIGGSLIIATIGALKVSSSLHT